MSEPGHRPATIPGRPARRGLAALAATLLLPGGLYAYTTAAAPGAHAAATMGAALLVEINPGDTSVGLATVSTTVTYTCTDTSAPGGHAQLRVDFDQAGNDTSGELSVPCGTADTGKSQTVTAVQVGMSGSREVTAAATLDDGDATASSDADTVSGQSTLDPGESVTFPGDGTVTATGTYDCAAGTGVGAIIVSASQENTSTDIAAGTAVIAAPTCDGTSHAYTVTIASSNPGGTFSSTDPDVSLTQTETNIVAGIDLVQEGSVLALYD
ncbi:MAG: hypothetical protein JO345_24820 [Streptosporangiaceae bacterium]|nr:hypothetical protein [Streptosporangiaceae bacterium]